MKCSQIIIDKMKERCKDLLEECSNTKINIILKKEFGHTLGFKTLNVIRKELNLYYIKTTSEFKKQKLERCIELLKMYNNGQTNKKIKEEFNQGYNSGTLNEIREKNEIKSTCEFNITKENRRIQRFEKKRLETINAIEELDEELTEEAIWRYNYYEKSLTDFDKVAKKYYLSDESIENIKENIKKINDRCFNLGIHYLPSEAVMLGLYLGIEDIIQKDCCDEFGHTTVTLRNFFKKLKLSPLEIAVYKARKYQKI